MTLTPSWNEEQQQYEVRGTVRGSAAAVPLGRKYFALPESPEPPAFVIGFDDNISDPVIVRVFYDPAAAPAIFARAASKAVFVGMVQTMQIKFRGTLPIPASLYGGMLGGRQVYQFGQQNEFIDFMDPVNAEARNATKPLYPYNAMLMDDSILRLPGAGSLPTGDLRADTLAANYPFFAAELPNGSLYSATDVRSQLSKAYKSQSAVASLTAEITPSLTTPADVAGWLDDNHLLVEYPIGDPVYLSFLEPYQYALNELRTVPLDGDDTPMLAGVDNSAIAAEVIGDYVLLTLPEDDDGNSSTLVVTVRKNSSRVITSVVVYSFDADEMLAMTAYQAKELFWRIRDYQSQAMLKADTDQVMTDADGTGGPRGFSGLLVPPFDLDPDNAVFELVYQAIPVGYHVLTDRDHHEYLQKVPHWGIKWSALLTYSAVDCLLSVSAVGAPKLRRSIDTPTALARFDKVLATSAPGQPIDVSNFTKAAMKRDNFASGVKLTFLSATGTEITS